MRHNTAVCPTFAAALVVKQRLAPVNNKTGTKNDLCCVMNTSASKSPLIAPRLHEGRAAHNVGSGRKKAKEAA
jgi:hypothetical protein